VHQIENDVYGLKTGLIRLKGDTQPHCFNSSLSLAVGNTGLHSLILYLYNKGMHAGKKRNNLLSNI
jgi:hypothetical protein